MNRFTFKMFGLGRTLLMLTAVVALGLMGCAAIIHGTDQNVKISSSPDGASVVIYDSHGAVVSNSSTPTVANLKRGDGFFKGATYRVEITKSGYETQTVQITSSMNGGSYLIGNFFLGGFLGWVIVDPMTGGMWSLKPKNINTSLRQSLSLKNDESDEGIYIVLKEQIPEDIFNTLDLVKID